MSLSDLEKQIILLDPANIGNKTAKIIARAMEYKKVVLVSKEQVDLWIPNTNVGSGSTS